MAGFELTGLPSLAARASRRLLSFACSSRTARGSAIVIENPLAWQKPRATRTGSSEREISMRSMRPAAEVHLDHGQRVSGFGQGRGGETRSGHGVGCSGRLDRSGEN